MNSLRRVSGLIAVLLLSVLEKKGRICFSDAATKIHMGGQGKHIPGHNNYDPSRDALTADPQDFLAGVHSGRYPVIRSIPRGNSTSSIVDFVTPIGDFKANGVLVGSARYGQIVQGKNGAHIIPANPNQY